MTIATALQDAGYQTAMFGKLHFGNNPKGFDQFKILPGQGTYYNPDFITPEGRTRIDGYCTDIVTDMAVDFLVKGRDEEKPFMLMVQHKAPHRNWLPALRHLELYDDIDIPEPPTLFDDYRDYIHNRIMYYFPIPSSLNCNHNRLFFFFIFNLDIAF